VAGASLLALIDDIATILDDVAILSKVAARKTAGVLGDDLALNAQQVAGVRAERELPVVWAVAKGSFLNKAILVPAALLISAVAPWLVTPLLMAGGLFLCFEGVEKLVHTFRHKKPDEKAHEEALLKAMTDPSVDLVALEKKKIKGAIRTDFILSAEIIVIALGIVAASPFVTRLSVLVVVAVMITVAVYGLVAAIVKLDDVGLHLSQKPGDGFVQAAGRGILWLAPVLMKILSILGTAAMFLVGGGILAHGLPGLESWIHHATDEMGAALEFLTTLLFNAGLGIAAGAVTLAVVSVLQKLFRGKESGESH
jgi:predicted DNA repair protein MutK